MESERLHYAPGVPAEIEPPAYTLDALLARSAAVFPNSVAVDFLGRTISYAELAHQTRKAAQALNRLGVGRGDVVSLVMPNCPQHVVAFFAVLSLGATVAEHNPLAPPKELREQLSRRGSRAAIVWEQTLEALAADGPLSGPVFLSVDLSRELPHLSRLLLKLPLASAREQRSKLRGAVPAGVASFDDLVKKARARRAPSAATIDDVAVLIHTGGTTGTPKAVMLTHRNIASNVEQTKAWVPVFTAGDEVLCCVLPFFHAFGMMAAMLGVKLGAAVVLLPKFDPHALLAANRRRGITLLPGVAPMFARILDAAAERGEDLSGIGFAFSGAMALDGELAARWENATGGFIIEGYGMTEASPIIAGSPVSPARRPSTLGLPFPSTQVRIVAPDGAPVDASAPDGAPTPDDAPTPNGAPASPPENKPAPENATAPEAARVGEILVRGPQVFVGYHNDPEETSQAFTEDGWLRTGDLGYWDDGFLVMADRAKELIINGGFNVYPSQVEEAIKGMPGVRDVAVVGMPEESRDSRGESVVAALVLEPGAAVDLDAVRRWTQGKLSHYAMPRSIAVVADLPRSQLGKVLRRNVREQLQGFELKAGQWRAKASELTEATGEAFEAFVSRLQEQYSVTREQLSDWLASKGESLEGLRSRFAERAPSPDSVRTWFAENFSIEGLKAWLSSRAQQNSPDKGNPIGPGVGGQLA